MGSDNGPEAIISGASLSKERHPKIEYIFFGIFNAKKITLELLQKYWNGHL